MGSGEPAPIGWWSGFVHRVRLILRSLNRMSEDEFSRRLRAVGAGLDDRMDPDVIEDALEWLDHGECALAFGLLLDIIDDQEVPLRAEELDEFLELAEVYSRSHGVSVQDLEKRVVPPRDPTAQRPPHPSPPRGANPASQVRAARGALPGPARRRGPR